MQYETRITKSHAVGRRRRDVDAIKFREVQCRKLFASVKQH